jgi:membrane-associated protease RseP (regulator of RpoE activity)
MSDETPQSEGEPSPAVPDETPTAENKPFTYDDAVKNTGDEDDVAPPAAAAPAATPDPDVTQAAPAAPAAAPVAAAPAAAAADRPAGIFVPKWVGLVAAAIVAALVFGGIGYAIGDSSSGSSSTQNAGAFPGNGNGTRQLPNGGQVPGNGNGPFNQVPNENGNGNGGTNGGNGTGNNGGATASDAAFLGVGVGAPTAATDKGAQVTEVADGSPAATAGLKTGDVITAIDNTTVDSPLALRTAVQQHKSGDQVTVTYTRDGQSNSVKVTLTSRSTAQSS